jgi:hypothetical protein
MEGKEERSIYNAMHVDVGLASIVFSLHMRENAPQKAPTPYWPSSLANKGETILKIS